MEDSAKFVQLHWCILRIQKKPYKASPSLLLLSPECSDEGDYSSASQIELFTKADIEKLRDACNEILSPAKEVPV